MERVKISKILIITLILSMWQVCFSYASTPMGITFLYQGYLVDGNDVLDGIYDIQFKLFDDPNIDIGIQLGPAVLVQDVNVEEGWMTAELDFGAEVFDGNTLWIEIGVDPNTNLVPNIFDVLLPQ